MSLEARREAAKKKYRLGIQCLKKSTEQKKVTPIARWIEQVEKLWGAFQDAENEYIETLEMEDAMVLQDTLWNLEEEKNEEIAKATEIMLAAGEPKDSSKNINVGDSLCQKLSSIPVNRKGYEDFQVLLMHS